MPSRQVRTTRPRNRYSQCNRFMRNMQNIWTSTVGTARVNDRLA